MMKNLSLWLITLILAACAGCTASIPESEESTNIKFIWDYRTGDYVRSTPLVDEGVLYVGSDDNYMHAVDVETGDLLWQFETGDNITSSPLTLSLIHISEPTRPY